MSAIQKFLDRTFVARFATETPNLPVSVPYVTQQCMQDKFYIDKLGKSDFNIWQQTLIICVHSDGVGVDFISLKNVVSYFIHWFIHF